MFTASNITYDEIRDTVHLPKGQYRSVEESARLRMHDTDTETVVEFQLSALESFALYHVEEE